MREMRKILIKLELTAVHAPPDDSSAASIEAE
jgi:hypothetical protein